MIGEQKNKDDGFVSIATKVPIWIADLLTILAKQRGMEVYELLQLLVNGFISAAKHNGPVTPDIQLLLDSLKLDVAFNKAFNFASPTARAEIAQIILILQQPGKHGFGMKMIDRPFISEATETACADDIIERVLQISMPGLAKRIDKVGERLCCNSQRETLTLLSEYMNDSLDKEEEQQEMPGYGTYHDYGKVIEYGKKHKRVPHRTPDSVDQQQTIHFEPEDMPELPELQEWEGEHRQHEEPADRDLMDELSKGHAMDDDLESEMGFRPHGQEW